MSNALHAAILNGDTDAVRRLIEQNSDVESLDESGRTPLLSAARFQNAEIIRLLLAAGAQVNTCGSRGTTALFVAVRMGNTEAAKLLIELISFTSS
jgi:ankyrin repeat protein